MKRISKPKVLKSEEDITFTPKWDPEIELLRFKAVCSKCGSEKIDMVPCKDAGPVTIEFHRQELPDQWGLWRRWNNKAIIFVYHGGSNGLIYNAITEDGHVVINPKPLSELPKGNWEKAEFTV